MLHFTRFKVITLVFAFKAEFKIFNNLIKGHCFDNQIVHSLFTCIWKIF